MKTGSKFLSSVCRRGVGSNSIVCIVCIECNSWVHRKFPGLRKFLRKAVDFVCFKCFGFIANTEDDRDLTLYCDVIVKVTKFLYLGDVLTSEGVQEAVRVRIKIWKEKVQKHSWCTV